MCIYTLAHLKVLKKMLAPKSYSNLNRHLVTSYPLPISFLRFTFPNFKMSPQLKNEMTYMSYHVFS